MHIPSHCNDNHLLLFSLPPSNLPIMFILITLTIQSSPYMYLVKLQYTHHMTTLGTLCNPPNLERIKKERKKNSKRPTLVLHFVSSFFLPTSIGSQQPSQLSRSENSIIMGCRTCTSGTLIHFIRFHHMNDDDDMIVIIKLSLKQDTLPGLPIVSCDRAVLVNSTQRGGGGGRRERTGRGGKCRICGQCGHLRETPFVFRFSPSFLESE